jgi:anti-sigma regulatory factor (Ser/Thr protein kinase)
VSPTRPVNTLCLTAELKDLARIRAFIQESVAPFSLPPDVLSGVLLAVDEAVTNVIMYGYAGHGGPLEVEIWRRPGVLSIQLRDEAPLFDPTAVPEPDLDLPVEERMPGGLGIYLIRQAMDEVEHASRPSGGNELTLTKRLP